MGPPLTVRFSARASYDQKRHVVVPARLAHEYLDRSEKLVRDLSGGAPSSLAEAAQQPLVAEERATLIQGLGHAVRVHHQGLARSQIDQLLLIGCRRGDTERRAARGQRLDVTRSDDQRGHVPRVHQANMRRSTLELQVNEGGEAVLQAALAES